MRLSVRHVTTYRYDPPAQGLALRLRLFAHGTVQQHVLDWRVTVDDKPVTPLLTTANGEAEALWFSRRRDEAVTIVAEGTVETIDHAGVLGKAGDRVRPGVYLRETPLTVPGDAIAELAAAAEGETQLARLHALSAAVAEGLDYRAGATDAETTAEQAAALGVGVCQDYAQVFIAAARSLGVPARYVIGYLHNPEAAEYASHAWAEAHLDGLGWVGFDPLHQVCPSIDHIRLCTGLDAPDAAPIRGTMLPGSDEKMEIEVAIAPSGQVQGLGQGLSQSQSQ
ncbi:MAG: transglutaminase family protein [Pseudomonadota bacterium]